MSEKTKCLPSEVLCFHLGIGAMDHVVIRATLGRLMLDGKEWRALCHPKRSEGKRKRQDCCLTIWDGEKNIKIQIAFRRGVGDWRDEGNIVQKHFLFLGKSQLPAPGSSRPSGTPSRDGSPKLSSTWLSSKVSPRVSCEVWGLLKLEREELGPYQLGGVRKTSRFLLTSGHFPPLQCHEAHKGDILKGNIWKWDFAVSFHSQTYFAVLFLGQFYRESTV